MGLFFTSQMAHIVDFYREASRWNNKSRFTAYEENRAGENGKAPRFSFFSGCFSSLLPWGFHVAFPFESVLKQKNMKKPMTFWKRWVLNMIYCLNWAHKGRRGRSDDANHVFPSNPYSLWVSPRELWAAWVSTSAQCCGETLGKETWYGLLC